MKILNYKKLVISSILLAFLNLNLLWAEENEASNDEEQYIINEDNVDLSDIEKKLIIAINKYRESEGRLPFKINSSLMNEARRQSSLMMYYGQRHYLCRTENNAKESIYYGPKDIDVVINGFVNSPSNKELLTSDTKTHIGVGAISSNNSYRGSWVIRYATIETVKADKKDSVKENKSTVKKTSSKKEVNKDTNTKKENTSVDTTNVENKDSSKEETKKEEVAEEANPYIINPEEIELTPEEKGMIVAVNQYRAQYNRSILIVSKLLMNGARQQSRLMLSYGRQNHWLFPSNGASTENIFYSPRTLLGAMNGFKRSYAHNGNMLNPYHTHIGVGAIITGYVGSWTQRFARFRVNTPARTTM